MEHVGPEPDQIRFVRELRRVAHQVFLTTPNRLFPIEVHTMTLLLHLILSPKWFDRYLDRIGKPWAKSGSLFTLSVKEVKKILYKAGVEEYQIIKNRLFGFVVDFVIIF